MDTHGTGITDRYMRVFDVHDWTMSVNRSTLFLLPLLCHDSKILLAFCRRASFKAIQLEIMVAAVSAVIVIPGGSTLVEDSPGKEIHPLRWRHNRRNSVSNHQPHDCLLNRLFRRRSKKTSKLRVAGLCAGNSPGTGEFPAQMASNAENVHLMTPSWYSSTVSIHEILSTTRTLRFDLAGLWLKTISAPNNDDDIHPSSPSWL